MNILHALVKVLTKASTASKPPHLFIFLYFCLFVCLAHFTLFAYKSLIMVVENIRKYHWIQHKNKQSVVALSELFD